MPKSPTKSWLTAYNAFEDQFALGSDGLGIFALNLRFNLDDIQAVAAEAITGGGDDKKCDILYIDRDVEIAVIAQCYSSDRSREAAPSNKASDLNTAVSWVIGSDITTLPDGLQGRAEELRSAIEDGEIKQLYVWYVHNLPESKNVDQELQTVGSTTRRMLDSLESGSEVNVLTAEIGLSELDRMYQVAERTVYVTDELETVVPDVIELDATSWSSLMTTVPASWLQELYNNYGSDLFSANLRGYLGSRNSDSNINNAIKESAENSPENFYVYNNGVTALVLDYKVGPRRRGRERKLAITGISIVNGAQTTGSLGSVTGTVDARTSVPIRFIKSTNDALISDIVRYNNSQNKLQAADFRSTDAIQDRLRREFDLIPGAEYEGGRRGGASDAIKRSKFSLPSYTVGQALSSFHGNPVLAYNKKSEIWTNEKNYRQVFTDHTTAKHIVFCYSLLQSINNLKIALISKRGVDASALTEREAKQLDFLSKKGANFLLVHAISRSIETILGKRVVNRFAVEFKRNVSPHEAAVLWEPIVQLFLSLSEQLDDAFTRDRISQEALDRSLQRFSGVIDSLAQVHEGTFSAFASGVSGADSET